MESERHYSTQYQSSKTAELYEKQIYASGSHDDVIWRIEQQLLTKLIKRNCPSPSDANVMDFACGTGRVTAYLDKHRGELVGSLIGVDISNQMLELARQKVSDQTELRRADIVNNPQDVPGDIDIITAFRFLLLAEPDLREAVVSQLLQKLRDSNSFIIFSLHGNPNSYRALARLRNKLITRSRPKLPNFGLRDLQQLADRVGMKIVDATGAGYLPHSLAKFLPRPMFRGIEQCLAGWPFFWRFGSNLLVVCKRKD